MSPIFLFTRRFALSAVMATLGTLDATAASATNEAYQIFAQSCSPYIDGGCDQYTATTPVAGGVNIGGGYAFASGYHGGFALASAGFEPGAPQLLAPGQYREASIGYMTYSFQVQGAPDTFVPLHMIANVSVSPIHLSDAAGNAVVLSDTDTGPAPTDQFKIVGSASVQVSLSRGTPYPQRGASASVEAVYDPSGFGGYCRNCGGGGDAFDTTIWVYSNSDIDVILNTSALVQYDSNGPGGANAVFGSVSGETDPIFSIDDPAYLGFSIFGVPTGFPPPAGGGVPEPASWAMMVAGFGLAGSAMRRRPSQQARVA